MPHPATTLQPGWFERQSQSVAEEADAWPDSMKRAAGLPGLISKDGASAKLSNAVYLACRLLEDLQVFGRLRGNGHHMRQAVAEFAANLLRERWQED